ncbi:MAG: type II secretion system protein GspN [Deltaproteobacteria bacterium]|nr:type II secretion system protein GspN [Deltaproteobacteria bacterium]
MKKLLYSGFFGIVFLFSLYLTFPVDTLRPLIETQMTQAIQGSYQGAPLRIQPSVRIGEISLWRLSGVTMTDLDIQMGSETLEPGPSLNLKELGMRLGIFSTLFGNPKIEFSTQIHDGRARGYAVLSEKGGLSSLWLDLDKIDLNKLRGPVPDADLKLSGIISLDLDLDLGKNPAKDGSGDLEIDFKNLSVGPGPLPIPGGFGGAFTIPLIKLGQFSGTAGFKNGKAHIKNLKLTGGDVEAQIDATLELKDNILFSPLKGSGWFRLKPAFKDANPNIAMLLDFNPDLKAAEEADGTVHFTLFGSLMAPTPKWGKS